MAFSCQLGWILSWNTSNILKLRIAGKMQDLFLDRITASHSTLNPSSKTHCKRTTQDQWPQEWKRKQHSLPQFVHLTDILEHHDSWPSPKRPSRCAPGFINSSFNGKAISAMGGRAAPWSGGLFDWITYEDSPRGIYHIGLGTTHRLLWESLLLVRTFNPSPKLWIIITGYYQISENKNLFISPSIPLFVLLGWWKSTSYIHKTYCTMCIGVYMYI